jgi:hypothetical protein
MPYRASNPLEMLCSNADMGMRDDRSGQRVKETGKIYVREKT